MSSRSRIRALRSRSSFPTDMRHNVTTPGGFFVGLGGIITFCVVSGLVYLWVKAPAHNDELRPQQIALGLVAEGSGDDAKKKNDETEALLQAAGDRYNDGRKPNIDNLTELRGVLRYRESQK